MNPRKKNALALLIMLFMVGAIWGTVVLADLKPKLGLDLQGGLAVVLTPKTAASEETIEQAVEIIRRRVDDLGVAEPDIAREGENIIVQLSGVKSPEKALDVIGRTAELQMRAVKQEIPPGAPNYATTKPDCDDADAIAAQTDPAREVILCARRANATTKKDLPKSQWPKLQLAAASLVGRDVSGADAQFDPNTTAGWTVDLKLSSGGSKKFEKITGELACGQGSLRQLAIALDQVVESHPQMSEEVKCKEGIRGGTAVITGTFSEDEAKDLAAVLKYGALPVALEPSTTTRVSPTLGRDTLNTGLIAGSIGLGIVLLYVLVFYRVLGILIWIGMAVFSALVLGVVIILGETAGFSLTLAGIAGLIVSVGIAADSFIVYFERLKDEINQGRTPRAAVDRAWASARRTIIAADLVTALAAIVLYVLAVGSVRGFALMLGLATLLDIFISFWLMHPGVWFLAQTRLFSGSKRLGLARVAGVHAEVGGR